MEKTKAYFWSIGLFAAFMCIAFLFGYTSNVNIERFFTITTPLFPICFGILAIIFFKGSSQGKSAFFMTLTFCFWFVGDILWYFFLDEAVLSIADIFYLSAYALFLIGVIIAIRLVNESFFREKKVPLIIGLIAAFFIYNYFFPVVWDSSTSVIENIVISGYVLADFILLSAILLLIYSVMSGKFAAPWIAIGIGALLTWIGDIIYALDVENYISGMPLDLTWNLGYLFFALGMILLVQNAKAAMENAFLKPALGTKKRKK